jgi:hypothetical protein
VARSSEAVDKAFVPCEIAARDWVSGSSGNGLSGIYLNDTYWCPRPFIWQFGLWFLTDVLGQVEVADAG